MKFNSAIKVGVLTGIIASIVWYFITQNLGPFAIEVYIYRLGILFGGLLLAIPIAIYSQKRKQFGILTFKTALQTGILCAISLAIVFAIFNSIYHNYLSTDTVEYFVGEAKKYAIENNKTEIETQQIMDAERNTFSSYRIFLPAIFMGLVLSLLSGALFQKKG